MQSLLLKLLSGLLPLFITACGGHGPDGLTVLPNGDMVVAEGSAQKGPFIAGSTVTLNVLSTQAASQSKALGQIGRTFTFETNNEGRFPLDSVSFLAGESFAQVVVEGYYFDEISGQRSNDYIALRGIFDISSTSLNVNVLTDMAHMRVQKLAKDFCYSASDAMKCNLGKPISSSPTNLSGLVSKAEREVLAAFNIQIDKLGLPQKRFGDMNIKNIQNSSSIFNSNQHDQVLLAISALVMQIGEEGSGVTDFLSAFGSDIADNGKIDDVNLKAQIAKASATVNFVKVANNMNNYYRTNKYLSKDLQKWVDPSGGLVGVISDNADYYSVTPTQLKYQSKSISFQSSKDSCLLLTSIDALSKIIPVASPSTTVNSGKVIKVMASSTPYLFSIESILTKEKLLNGRAKVVSWDLPVGTSDCSTTAPSESVGLYYFASTPPDFKNFVNEFVNYFSTCFNLTVPNRVRQVDLTNPDIPNAISVAPSCQALVDSPAIKYLHNGYKAGEQFYSMLSDPAMTKTARIIEMDVVDYFIGKDSQPVVKVLFTYVDRFNRKGSLVAIVRQDNNYINSSTSGWYNTGNQEPVDINLMVGVRSVASIPVIDAAKFSDMKKQFKTAFVPSINNNGPGVLLSNGQKLTSVKILGPGLPLEGLVYIPPQQSGQSDFDFSNASGILPDGRAAKFSTRCGAVAPNVGFDPMPGPCPLNWVDQTDWIAPTALLSRDGAKTLTYSLTGKTFQSAKPAGGNWLPENSLALATRGAEYKFLLFYGNSIQPQYVYTKRLSTSMPTIADISSMSWVDLAYVDNVSLEANINAATSINDSLRLTPLLPLANTYTASVVWSGQVQNSIEISALNVTLEKPFTPRATPPDYVARGYNNAILSPQFNQDGNSLEMQYTLRDNITQIPIANKFMRTISLSHRTWDGSWKSQDFQIENLIRQ